MTRTFEVEYGAQLPELPEPERRKLPSLTMDEFLEIIERPGYPMVFHNGGKSRRIVSRHNLMMICYTTRPTARNGCCIIRNDFLRWAKGFIEADGTVHTKGVNGLGAPEKN